MITYKTYVYWTFEEDANAQGVEPWQVCEILERWGFEQIERYLVAQGYDVKGDWLRDTERGLYNGV